MGGYESKKRRGLKLKHTGSPKVIEMPPDLGDQLVAHCQQGLSIKSFTAVCGFSWETLQEFRKTDAQFADRYRQAKDSLHLHCEKQLNEVVDSARDPRVFNALKFKIQNLIGWSDRTETKSKSIIEQKTTLTIDTSKLSDEELDKQLKELEK